MPNKQNHKETFLLKPIITVKATLWQTIFPFKKYGLLLIVFFSYNTMGQFHGIPWVDFTIPRADGIYNTMGKFHGSMNNMGG